MVNFNGAVKSGESRVNKSGGDSRGGHLYLHFFNQWRHDESKLIELDSSFFFTLSRLPIIDTLLIAPPGLYRYRTSCNHNKIARLRPQRLNVNEQFVHLLIAIFYVD